MSSVTLKDVRDARERIRDSIHYTPVLTSTYLNTLSGHSLYFKCENMQKTGSFKVLAAYLLALQLSLPLSSLLFHFFSCNGVNHYFSINSIICHLLLLLTFICSLTSFVLCFIYRLLISCHFV